MHRGFIQRLFLWVDYKDFLDSCKISGYAFNLYNQSMTPQSDTSDDNSCTEGLFATASTNAHNIYVAYIDSVRRDFQEAYLNKCLNVQPQLSMIAKLYEYHYTLYYYDQSGNLVKTIPPEGVKLLTNEEVARVQLGRKYYREDCYQYADELDLNSGYADFTALPYLALHDSAFSVESYIYFNNNSSQGIYSQYDSANDKGYQLFVRNDSLVIRLSENVGTYLEATCGTIAQKVNLNTYNHIVIERLIDSLNPVELFINGNNVPLTTINSDSGFVYNGDITANTDLLIGRVPSASGSFTGRIKQFRLYKRAMTNSEIRRNAFDNCLQPADKTALVLWAPINEGSGDSTKNIVYNTIGTLNGTWNWISNRIIIYPHHNLPSTYQYSSLNQVLQQYSPDGDTSHFWYDRLGRLTVSQNSEQLKNDSYSAAKGRYSYTTYDALGRITEVGEKSDVTDITSINTKDTAALNLWMASGTNKQVTRTIYDQPDENIVSHPDITVNQSYASSRKRVVASLYSEAGTFSASSYDNGTHYAYDINGNVKTLWQEIGKMRLLSDSGIKRMDYDYDLVSGKVNKVMYQQGKGDQFFYKYLYDAENRVTDAQSSRDGLVWINDASYSYYLHGPLARTELGQYKLQGIDYAYTLQGWLKGINSAVLNSATDIGKDGNGFSTTFGRVAKDVYGFTLGYYNNDYSPIGGTGGTLGLNYSFGTPDPSSTGSGLFNGNISNTTLALNKFDTGAVAGYTYGYDQLNRFNKMDRHTPVAGSATWDNSSIIDAYKEQVSYDANGNILKYFRNGQASTSSMDDLTYKYKPGSNQLDHVDDAVSPGNYSTDIDDQDTLNYQYDNIGNLKKDFAEGIDTVRWTLYGKINRVVKNTAGTAIDYSYDAAGNRTIKEVAAHDTLTQTYYVRDASGNVMAVYNNQNAESLKWSEQHLYGISRLGMLRIDSFIAANPPNANGTGIFDELLYGKRNYELANHLGNVLATISDKKIGHELNDTTVDYFNADVISANDYYPFGMMMLGRKYSIAGTSYRYSINGQEKEKDLNENITSAEFWMYDSRIARRWNADPMVMGNTSLYSAFNNNPIMFSDPLGLDTVNSSKKAGTGDVFQHQNGKSNFFWDKTKKGWEGGGESGILSEITITVKRKNQVSFLPSAFNHSTQQGKQWDIDENNFRMGNLSNLSSSQIGMYQQWAQSDKDWRKMSLGVVGIMAAPFVLPEVVGALELNFAGAGVDFINQKFIQGKSWSEYNIGATLTAGIFGGGPLKFATFGSSGYLFNFSGNGLQSGTWFQVTNKNVNAYRAAFVSNLIANSATNGFAKLSGITNPLFTSPGSKFILTSIDLTNGTFAAPLGNKLEEKLNEGGNK